MADKRISQLIERVDIANNDVLPIVASGAITTNKVTISSIQTYMQENLDVGVTSVGITIGTSGTDVNVSGSPVTTSGNITINIPDASASARGVVTSGSQTFGGVKTFADGLSLPSLGGGNQITRIVNIGTLHQGTAGLNQIGFNSGNNIYFGKGLSNGGVISWNNSAVRFYTLQDADGTLAFTSQLDGYVTLDTAQTITGSKTFNSRIIGQGETLTGSGSPDTLEVFHTSGSGIAVDISKAGDGEGLRVAKTSGSGNAMSITGGNFSAEDATFSSDIVVNGVNLGRGGGNVAGNVVIDATLANNTTGIYNFAIGGGSLANNTTGRDNVAIGYVSLNSNTTGQRNTSVGGESMYDNLTGSENTSIGLQALSNMTSGNWNVSIGNRSATLAGAGGGGLFTSNNSIYIGYDSRAGADSQTNQIVIGHQAIGNGSNTVTIGNSSITDNYFSGEVHSTSFEIAAAGTADPTILRNTSGTTSSTTGSNVIGFNGTNNIFVTTESRGGFILGFNNSVSNREYTLPDASGTIALTSNLGAYLPLTGGTLTGGLIVENNVITQDGTRPILTLQQSGNTKVFLGISSSASDLVTGDSSGDAVFRKPASSGAFRFSVDGGTSSALVIASTGAATFSSSVTARNGTSGVAFETTNAVNADFLIETTSGGLTKIGTSGNALGINVGGGNVGIGTASPSSILDVRSANVPRITLVKNGIVSWFIGNPSQGTSNDFSIGTDSGGNTQILNITAGGNVGIGTDSPQGRVESKTPNIIPGDAAYAKKAFVANMPLNTANVTGSGLAFFDSTIHGADVGYSYDGTGYYMAFATNDNTTGSPIERVRITRDGYTRLSSNSGGIQFNGDTAAANALDDYEEGTFTPTFVGSGGGTPTYSTQIGKYTKIGNTINVVFWIRAAKGSLSGNISVAGFPFSKDSTTVTVTPLIAYRRFASNFIPFGDFVGTDLYLYKQSSDAVSVIPITDADLSNVGSNYNNIGASFTYLTD